MNITRFSNAQSFLRRAENWLLQQEAENNLILGIANSLLSDDHSYGNPIYLATIETDGQVSGCAWRTPPHKLGLTRLPVDSVSLLVRDVADVYAALPAVLGPEAEATEFANLWARQLGSDWAMGTRQRIFFLDRVMPSTAPIKGALRKARSTDATLAADWGAAFARDTGVKNHDPLAHSERLIRSGSLYLWDDRECRSMAAAVGTTPNGTRVGYVYTPPSFRSRGYATATVASLSRLLLDGGQRFCFLFTDLGNPISNAIYEKIGYRPVTDVVDVNFC